MPDSSNHSPRIERKRAAKREQILAAAMEVLADGGLEAVTVHRLAGRLDYTAGALYRYFPSKHALLSAMQRYSVNALHEHYRAHGQATADACRRRGLDAVTSDLFALMSLAEFCLGLTVTLPHHSRLINVMLADPRTLVSDEDAALVAPAFFGLLQQVAALFDNATASAALSTGNSLDRGVVFWSALQGTLQLDKLERFDAHMFQPKRLGRQLARTLMLGWGADAHTLDQAVFEIDRASSQ